MDLLWGEKYAPQYQFPGNHNNGIIEAYRRGKEKSK